MDRSLSYMIFTVILFTSYSCSDKEGNFDASGNFEATEIIISSEATGRIISLGIEEGQEVDQNVQLGYVDTVQLQLQKERLISSVKAVRSRKADIPTQIAAIDQQISNLDIEKTRAERLITMGAGNTKTLDDINAQISTLNKQRSAQLSSMQRNNSSADSEGSAIEAQIKQLEDQIGRCKIYSPVKGTIIGKYAEEGEFTVVGKPLFKVADLDTITLKAYVTQSQLTKLKLRDKVRVFADFGVKERKEYEGIVSWISDKAEFTPKTIQTKEERENFVYALKIRVKNDGYLKIGMYGELQFLNEK
ncbi:MAG: efflux RND transporter periplasmic adaptor subunit [Rikenellaceae bacterium]|nr:efflux RND transporter periplasmic adaptor subunit [Rikenellaceae bacterium]